MLRSLGDETHQSTGLWTNPRHVNHFPGTQNAFCRIWRAKQELASDLLLWTPHHGHQTQVGRPKITYIDELCRDTRCLPEYLPTLMHDRDGWHERVRAQSDATPHKYPKRKLSDFRSPNDNDRQPTVFSHS